MNRTEAGIKDALRREMRMRRRSLPPERRALASRLICGKLIRDSRLADRLNGCGKCLAVYLASPDEIDLSELVLEALRRGITVVSPRWNGETYELARIRSLSGEDLRTGPMGILEPAEAVITAPEAVDAWIIPGLAFTSAGKRLGYGGGWYDRLLSAAAGRSGRDVPLKIGVGHSFQVLDDFVTEPHDILLDRIVTDA